MLPNSQLAANFFVNEFQAASNRPLTAADLPQMEAWAVNVLQPIRRAFGKLSITSYIRTGDVGRAHQNGGGIDIVPREASIDEVFAWIATYMTDTFGRAIHERDHIHIARRGPESWAGIGHVFIEPVEGEYVLASFAPLALADSRLLAVVLIAVAAVYTLRRKG